MTTFVPFLPSSSSPFQFQATLNGQSYNVVVKWNLAGQRYYANVFSSAGDRVATVAMVGSPPGYDISLVAGYFASRLVWRPSTGNFEVSP